MQGEGHKQGWKEDRGRTRTEAEGNEREVKDRPGRRKRRNEDGMRVGRRRDGGRVETMKQRHWNIRST